MRRVLVWCALLAGALLFTVPMLWTIATALRSQEEIARDPGRLLPEAATLANFPAAWNALPFPTFVANTVFVTLVSTLAQILTGSLVAYGFARFQFRGRNTLFYTMLATMMLPGQVTMIPVFLIWRELGAIDTFAPLTVPAFFGGGAFSIFLLRQFFMSIPRELDEAMLLDGASYLRIWWRLIMPLSTPAVTTVVVFSFIGNWDNFEGPLIYLNSTENYTVSIGLRMFQDSFGTNTGQLMAASLIHIVPTIVLFFAAQRYFVKGVNLSGLGGR
ncbi:MAG: carbohydrate ABC transporter permease [Fimbriimonadaceae bacterium]|nr:carbohydrate ABC transporter permease [Fimbriimonadaceae bacterium]